MRTILIFMLLLTLPASFIISEEYTCYISGKISGEKCDSLIIYGYDHYFDTDKDAVKLSVIKTDNEGNFAGRFVVRNLDQHKLSLDGHLNINFYPFPNDTIGININLGKTLPTWEFYGRNALYNNFRLSLNKKFRDNEYYSKNIGSRNYKKYFPQFDTLLKSMEEYHGEYFKNAKDINNIIDRTRYDLIFLIAAKKVIMLNNYFMSSNLFTDFSLPVNEDEIINIDINKFKYPGLKSYKVFLNRMFDMYCSWKSHSLDKKITLGQKYQLITENFSYQARDINLAYLFDRSGMMRYPSLQLYKEWKAIIKDYKTKTSNKEFIKYLETKLKYAAKFLPGNPAPDFTAFDSKGNKVKLSDFRGKPIYLEFWGTWCGSCRKQIPYMNKLIEKYKGKDIQFVKVAFESHDNKTWLKFIKEKKPEGIDLCVYGPTEAELLSTYKCASFPRYIIIDKNGNIVDIKAKRPENEELIKDLDKILNE